MLSVADRAILQQAAIINPAFAKRHNLSTMKTGARATDSAFVEQGGQGVTAVQPGTAILLYANDYPGGYFGDALFEVVDSNNNPVLPPTKIGVDLVGNAWLDWTAPMTEGTYIFYANANNQSANYVYFTVSSSAPSPSQNATPKTTNWLLIGGIALVVLGGFTAWAITRK